MGKLYIVNLFEQRFDCYEVFIHSEWQMIRNYFLSRIILDLQTAGKTAG